MINLCRLATAPPSFGRHAPMLKLRVSDAGEFSGRQVSKADCRLYYPW